MEIHSSSIATVPADYKFKNKTQETPRLNPEELNEKNGSSKLLPLNNTANTKLQDITEQLEQQNKRPNNLKSTRAINQYIEINTQPLKNQRDALISSIDIIA